MLNQDNSFKVNFNPERRRFLKAAGVALASLALAACTQGQEPVKTIPSEKYLTLPFRERDLKGQYQITEGWEYSAEEQAIHGQKIHLGIDFAVPYGTPVVAPFDGFAMSSYHAHWLMEGDRKRLYQEEPIRFSLGYFVQVYNPRVNRFIQLAHLSDIDPSIPFSKPVYDKEEDNWNPVNHTLTIEQLINHTMVAAIKRGDPLGRVGFSGLALGKEQIEYIEEAERPLVLDKPIRSWDEPHVHFEETFRNQKTGAKEGQRDPYDLYTTFENYPTPQNPAKMGPKSLWILGQDSLPLFAA